MDKKAARRANNSIAKSFRSSRVEVLTPVEPSWMVPHLIDVLQERYVFGNQLEFNSINDHILPSICHHEQDDPCQVSRPTQTFDEHYILQQIHQKIDVHRCVASRRNSRFPASQR